MSIVDALASAAVVDLIGLAAMIAAWKRGQP